ALSLVVQAPSSTDGHGGMVSEQSPPPKFQRRGRRGRLYHVARQGPRSLAVELESPRHRLVPRPLASSSASLSARASSGPWRASSEYEDGRRDVFTRHLTSSGRPHGCRSRRALDRCSHPAGTF